MNIANMLGTSTSSALEAVYGQKKKKENEDDAQSGVFSWRQDRVSVSEAALALLEAAGKEQAPPEDASSDNAASGDALNKTLDSGAKSDGSGEANGSVAASGEAGQSFSLGNGPSASDIDAKIKQLQQKIVETQNNELPEDAKSAMISGLQAQISALVQEKSAIESQSRKS